MLIASYAKINLFLEVLGRLKNNYHQVNTVLCSIDLFDEIKYLLTDSGSLRLWSQNPELCGEDNLIYRIGNYLKERYAPAEGVDIQLFKRIPIAAGLGGGSSNAALSILAFDKLWNLRLSPEEMHEIAALFGSDINFFLAGGSALGENRGERITLMSDIIIDNILLVNPGIRISAGEAYGATQLPAAGETKHFDPAKPIATMFNRLEAAVCKLYPVVGETLLALQEYGAVKSMLSGSGATCFGIFEDANGLALCRRHFENLGYFTQITRTISRSEYQKCFPS